MRDVALLPFAKDADSHAPTQWSARRTAVAALLMAVAYAAGAKIGISLTFRPHPISTLWPPNALLLAGLLLTPTRRWWALITALLPVHLYMELSSGIPLPMVLSWFVSNCTEALIGASLVRLFTAGRTAFDSIRDLAVFVACGTFLAAFLSSFLDAAFVTLNGWGQSSYWNLWRMRFFANALATQMIVPVVVIWGSRGRAILRQTTFARHLEAIALALSIVAVAAVAFMAPSANLRTTPALLYAPLPLLLWAALRFGPGGASAALIPVALIAITGAVHGRGPFSSHSPEDNALSVQLYLIIVSMPLMALAAVIRERERTEEALRTSQRITTLATGAAGVGLWAVDLETFTVFSDDVLSKIMDISRDEVPSQTSWMARVHPDDREKVLENRRVALADDAPRDEGGDSPMPEIEYRALHRDGTVRWLLTRGLVLRREDGTPYRLVGAGIDVTDRKLAEHEAVEQRRELAHLSRVVTLGGLSGTLAHELGQPLAAIMSNAQAAIRMLERDKVDHLELSAILEDIVRDDRRAGDVIKQLRQLLRREVGRRERLDLQDVVRETLTIAHSDLIAHDVTVANSVGTDIPTLSGDRVQLQQVLLNLILNACDAMDGVERGKRRLTFTIARESDDGIRISVSDTGPGIPEDRLPRIFEPFYTSKPQGLGLGLAICRSIVLSHGGRVWAESAGGATIHLVLPVHDARVAGLADGAERPVAIPIHPLSSQLTLHASPVHPDRPGAG